MKKQNTNGANAARNTNTRNAGYDAALAITEGVSARTLNANHAALLAAIANGPMGGTAVPEDGRDPVKYAAGTLEFATLQIYGLVMDNAPWYEIFGGFVHSCG